MLFRRSSSALLPSAESNHGRTKMRLAFVVTGLLIALSAPSVNAQALPARFEVVDSAGTIVGPVTQIVNEGGGPIASVLVSIDGHPTMLDFRSSGTILSSFLAYSSVVYTSNNCTGQGYALGGNPPLSGFGAQALVRTSATTWDFYHSDAPLQTIGALSSDAGDGCRTGVIVGPA